MKKRFIIIIILSIKNILPSLMEKISFNNTIGLCTNHIKRTSFGVGCVFGGVGMMALRLCRTKLPSEERINLLNTKKREKLNEMTWIENIIIDEGYKYEIIAMFSLFIIFGGITYLYLNKANKTIEDCTNNIINILNTQKV
jgi:hypothetical protein